MDVLGATFSPEIGPGCASGMLSTLASFFLPKWVNLNIQSTCRIGGPSLSC